MKETSMQVSLTAAEAYKRLQVNEEGTVHSYVVGFPGHFFGANLTEKRVRELLNQADERKQLYLVEKEIAGHNIKAWDGDTEEWIYLECKEGQEIITEERAHE